ncbi:MAG: extracellular solute-binding protein, partial [Chloroflexota bacterium]|nr:extracellular solute-binding protein [Chloroflexota bacterium]
MKASRKRLSRRSFLGTTAIAATGVIVAACGGQPAAPPKGAESKPAEQKPAAESKPGTTTQASAPQPAAATGPITIRYYTGEDDPTQIKVYEEIQAEYRQTHPNVSFSITPSPDDILQKMTAALAAKTAPEFSGLVEAEIMELGVRGFLEPVDPIVNDVGREDFKPNSLYTIKGNTYNLPYAGGGYGQIWYRTDLFEKEGLQPPKTWDEWKAAAQKLTKDGIYGFPTPGAKQGAVSVFLSQLFWSSGGTYYDEKLNVAFNDSTKDAMKQALEFY